MSARHVVLACIHVGVFTSHAHILVAIISRAECDPALHKFPCPSPTVSTVRWKCENERETVLRNYVAGRTYRYGGSEHGRSGQDRRGRLGERRLRDRTLLFRTLVPSLQVQCTVYKATPSICHLHLHV